MKRRVLTALVAIPVVLGVVGCTNAWPFGALLLAAGFVCMMESEGLFGRESEFDGYASGGVLALLLYPAVVRPFRSEFGLPLTVDPRLELPIAGALWLTGCYCAWKRVHGSTSWLVRALSPGWFAVPLFALFRLHPQLPDWGWHLPNSLLLVLLPIWAGDTAAMLGGMAFGKHKLAPTISPNKTWEGAIANLAAAILAGWGVGAWLGYEAWMGLACGAAAGVFGQAGDLFESAIKRAVGKKDSGALLPGHGGVLDRIDALLGAAIPVWLILWWSGAL